MHSVSEHLHLLYIFLAPREVHVLCVDSQSPLSARCEFAKYKPPDHHCVRVSDVAREQSLVFYPARTTSAASWQQPLAVAAATVHLDGTLWHIAVYASLRRFILSTASSKGEQEALHVRHDDAACFLAYASCWPSSCMHENHST